MGSSASKASRAAGASARKYPTRVSNPTTKASAPPPAQTSKPGPNIYPPPQASETKTEAIDLDARDPIFASRLSTLGAVQPNPHYSPTSTSSLDPQRKVSSILPSDQATAPPSSAFPDPRDNPSLRVLEARERIQEEAERELAMVGRRGLEGRKYPDVGIIQLALMRRQRGEKDESIEKALGVQKGRLALLGKGIIEPV
ncbi:hypothetical protein K469DRAFT_620857 [Zopfia rhizophila CBS 207.26]|uniref:Helix-turn-helix domain-containing protein n=1 Tax=Zopfia rhizophila CBS 207.26 TaxID=1314779 RepID=A0A6A6ERG8_9PEZI|nr:hypothetical protein K469DRAFT_620857 [Zopfia rhizophila CBS 207.26]